MTVHHVSAYLHSIGTLLHEIIIMGFEKGVTSRNLNMFMKGKEIDCHPTPAIHLQRSISHHPSPGIYLLSYTSSLPPPVIHQNSVTIHIHTRFISRRDLSVGILLLLQSLTRYEPSLAAIPLIAIHPASAFRFHTVLNCTQRVHIHDFSCSLVRAPKVIFTYPHDVRILHNSSCHWFFIALP